MKHLHTFESYLFEASSALSKIKSLIPGVKFQEEEIEFDPEEGYKSVESYSFEIPGVDEPAYINIYDGNSFCFFYDAAPLATSLHNSSEKNKMAQTQVEVPKPLNKLNKSIYDEVVAGVKEYVGESVTNETMVGGQGFGSKAAKFVTKIDEFDFFEEAAKKEDDGKLPEEWQAALKNLGLKPDDTIVCFFDAVGDRNKVIDTAKLAGLKYVEVEGGDDGGSAGIIFTRKQ